MTVNLIIEVIISMQNSFLKVFQGRRYVVATKMSLQLIANVFPTSTILIQNNVNIYLNYEISNAGVIGCKKQTSSFGENENKGSVREKLGLYKTDRSL